MGSAASTSRSPSTSTTISTPSQKNTENKINHPQLQQQLLDGGLSNSYRRMKNSGYNDKQIYQNLRETYGSLRLNKQLQINDHTIRGLAIQKLTNTLETNRILYPTPIAIPPSANGAATVPSNITPISEDRHGNNSETTSTVSTTPKQTPSGSNNVRKKPNLKVIISSDPDEQEEYENPQASVVQKTPRDRARISPSGAVRVGELAIHENGIQTSGFFEERQAIGFLTSGRSDFVIIGSLGRGASGSVLEALHIPTLTIVALKLLPIADAENLHQIASELDVLYRNLAELKLIDERLEDQEKTVTTAITPSSDSSHGSMTVKSLCPQLLAMYDAFLDPKSGLVNLVVEYMDGGSLQDIVDSGGYGEELVLADIAYQVLLGLEFLHSHGHMHRDIKPGNILLSCRGVVKVADFGISKAMDSRDTSFGHNSFVGTMCYMAPERISNGAYSFPGDIWSFGLTLLAVLMGRFPLQAPSNLTYWDLLRLICDEDSPEPGDSFSRELNMFINSCLSKDARDRPSVIMLLQHPWFLTNSSVLTAWKKSRRNTFVASDLIVLDSDEEKPFEDFRGGVTARSDLDRPDSTDGQSRLSRLTERTKSRYRSNSKSESENEFAANAVCYGPNDRPVSEYEEDQAMTAVRLEHLQRILEKTDHRYDQMAAMYRREKQKRLSGGSGDEGGFGRSSRAGERSSFHSMRSARSFLKAPSDPLIPLPNCYSQLGRRKWNHLAHQLHLPTEVVTNTAANIINQKYFAKEEL